LQSLGNTEWLFNREANRPLIAQPVRALAAPTTTAREIVIPALKALTVIPPWVILTTVVLATTGICATAIMHSRAELRESSIQFADIQMQVQSLRDTNQVLQRDISRLTKDPTAIELAARERLGMVKASDVVVTMESISKPVRITSNVSFVR
jgi:cell division protein FtsB